jgi:hypothetical protein
MELVNETAQRILIFFFIASLEHDVYQVFNFQHFAAKI